MTGILREERIDNGWNEAFSYAMKGLQSRLWTAIPGIIQSVDLDKQTCSVQIAIMAQQRLATGDTAWVQIKPLLDCPLVFPSGGGFVLTFPVAAGDEALVVFASRCIDAWWQSGGYNNVQAELRLHDLSDGFALVGPRSQPRKLAGVSGATAQFRSEDGALYIELAAGHVANIVAPGGLNIIGPVVFTGTVTANGHRIDQTHTHGGVMAGGASTGPVT